MIPPETADIGYYISILKRRKKAFIIPALVVLAASFLVARILPAIYQSSSTILIEEQQIPPEFVRSTVTGFADQRIQSLTQQILSRVKLWEIIQQFNLFPELRKTNTREEIIEKMHDNIKLNMISAEASGKGGRSSGSGGVTIAFSIAYRGKDPGTVQKVASTLVSLYLEQNLKTREAQAQSTTKFLEAELQELAERINGLGNKMTAFKEKHEGLLPDQQGFNRSQADRLEMEIKQLDNNIRGAEERRISLEGQLATVSPDVSFTGSPGEQTISPSARLKALELSLTDLQSKFAPDHPDIRKVKREIAELKKLGASSSGSAIERRKKLTQLKAELAEKQGKYSPQHPEVKKLVNEIARLEQEPPSVPGPQTGAGAENPMYINLSTQLQGAVADIGAFRKQQADLKEKLQMYRDRLEAAPKVEQEYLALLRDYQNASSKHQEVMNKILESRISEGMEEHQKGEKFTLIDPASYPSTPIAPNRLLIKLAGAILSLGVGVGFVALAEHLDHSVKNSDELVRLTGLPVLGSIIRIQTAEDVSRTRQKRKLIWTVTGVALVFGVIFFHFFYLDLWVVTARLERLANKYF